MPTRQSHRPHDERIARAFYNARARCINPSTNRFHRYGGRGIKILITLDQIRQLWDRDKASTMKRPSLDRINNDEDYTFENCRFIEFSTNISRRQLYQDKP